VCLTDYGYLKLVDCIYDIIIVGYGLDDAWLEFFLRWVVEGKIYRWPITHKQYWKRQAKVSFVGIKRHMIRRTGVSTFEVQTNGELDGRDLALLSGYMNFERNDVPEPIRSKDPIGSLLNCLICVAKTLGNMGTKDISVFAENHCVAYQTREHERIEKPSAVQSLAADPLRKRIERFDESFPPLVWTEAHSASMSNTAI
jgi:hypothetical protein